MDIALSKSVKLLKVRWGLETKYHKLFKYDTIRQVVKWNATLKTTHTKGFILASFVRPQMLIDICSDCVYQPTFLPTSLHTYLHTYPPTFIPT